MKGWGQIPFGETPFGHDDWAYDILWRSLPEEKKQQDLDAGGWYEKFVRCLLPSMNQLRTLIYKSHEFTLNPRTARADLLRYIAGNFGVEPDLEEPEEFQRTKIEIAGRWRMIKGRPEAYQVLCAVHGFNVDVSSIWASSTFYTTVGPHVQGESLGTI